MSSIAAFLVLGGATAFAAVQLRENSVGAKQLRKDAVTSPKVRNGSLKATDFAVGQLPATAKGATGATGPQGPKGPVGPSSEIELVSGETINNSDAGKTVLVECPADKKVIGADFNVDGAFSGLSPDEVKEATIDGVVIAPDLGSVTFEAFEQKGGTAANWSLLGRVFCAKVE